MPSLRRGFWRRACWLCLLRFFGCCRGKTRSWREWRSRPSKWARLWGWLAKGCERRAYRIVDEYTTAEAKRQFRSVTTMAPHIQRDTEGDWESVSFNLYDLLDPDTEVSDASKPDTATVVAGCDGGQLT